MQTTLETSPTGEGITRREFVASAAAAATTAVAVTLPAALPGSASAQEAPRLNTGTGTQSLLVKLGRYIGLAN